MEGFHSSATDAELIVACLGGDELAWHQLVHRYKNFVYSIPAKLGLKQDAATKIFVDVWQGCFDHLNELRHEQTLIPWLTRTTLAHCRGYGRIDAARLQQVKDEISHDRQVLAALQRLSPDKQQAIHELFSPQKTKEHTNSSSEMALRDLLQLLRTQAESSADIENADDNKDSTT